MCHVLTPGLTFQESHYEADRDTLVPVRVMNIIFSQLLHVMVALGVHVCSQ